MKWPWTYSPRSVNQWINSLTHTTGSSSYSRSGMSARRRGSTPTGSLHYNSPPSVMWHPHQTTAQHITMYNNQNTLSLWHYSRQCIQQSKLHQTLIMFHIPNCTLWCHIKNWSIQNTQSDTGNQTTAHIASTSRTLGYVITVTSIQLHSTSIEHWSENPGCGWPSCLIINLPNMAMYAGND